MKDLITYGDFGKLDIRAGKIVEASAPEWSDKLIRYEVDLGVELGKRVLFSGIRKWYKPEDLVGKIIPVVINLTPKKMGDEESQGMAIMADGETGAVMIFLPDSVEPGTVIR
ncbi:MAG: Methionine-tRNA ligase [Candidatus Collierbacteria bacterium GW2011_GWB1_45_35]|uniref:Methionine-tRNA ligase n=2 Tax=Candidatus Collieribacteriota TaxID=1752725 RepID=A0A0G1KTD1_9BACT|nr:MAG: Methionine-tRNA ligase [Microgenomates group bacterium GW2011_GWC1_44_23]KKT86785.1 MAG: Methionine-tRNA ligase [Candidatus Collierbacteria bacterium GW2011_GWA2_44_99]KKT95594.1 MAG: Methionine-tRNA ligase [Candidatus Collierbacteria bacterium GW2011_GWA1_45_15]KKU00506.1 MAG: Methionine-tRNA ligase [Candidatus Collierbacteria bacterium GW2011_GWB2_45_17]KKU05606.1 MAG: Methionine-tRNA ligase [Candidatus Collierbacteria bacterium GW2011_GWB1_45_35]KKU08219.1 MAG: Methionine-tRNA ligas